MRCIWTTSLELTWGVMALRRVVKNVIGWVFTRIKPDIARWIAQIRSDSLQTYSRTPGGDTVGFRRRATSLGPTNEVSDSEELESVSSKIQYRTPQGKSRPHLKHGETTPASLDRRLVKGGIPQIRLNGLTESGQEYSDDGSDEGYESVRLSGGRRKPKVDSYDLSTFVCDDDTSADDADATYFPSESDDESGQSNSEEEENAEYDSAEDGEISDEEVKELLDSARSFLSSGSQQYCYQLPYRSQPTSRLEADSRPTK